MVWCSGDGLASDRFGFLIWCWITASVSSDGVIDHCLTSVPAFGFWASTLDVHFYSARNYYDLDFLLNWRNLCGGCKTAVPHGCRWRVNEWNTHTHTDKHRHTRVRDITVWLTLQLWSERFAPLLFVCVVFFVRQYPAGMLKRTGLLPPHNRHQWVQQGHQLQRIGPIYSKRWGGGGRAKADGAGEEGGWLVCCLCVVISNENKLWYKTQFTTTMGNSFIPLCDTKCIHPSGNSCCVFVCESRLKKHIFFPI